MLGWLKRLGGRNERAAPAASSDGRKPRGVLPTYVTDKALTLCKLASRVENTYEARLALYFAVESKRQFVLRVTHGAYIAPDLRSKIEENGGRIEESTITDYSVFIGQQSATGSDAGGWVFGDNDAWE